LHVQFESFPAHTCCSSTAASWEILRILTTAWRQFIEEFRSAKLLQTTFHHVHLLLDEMPQPPSISVIKYFAASSQCHCFWNFWYGAIAMGFSFLNSGHKWFNGFCVTLSPTPYNVNASKFKVPPIKLLLTNAYQKPNSAKVNYSILTIH
jgi:hypothetical protein